MLASDEWRWWRGAEDWRAAVRRALDGGTEPPERNYQPLAGGDPVTLRGIPVLGRGCGAGHVRGTQPEQEACR